MFHIYKIIKLNGGLKLYNNYKLMVPQNFRISEVLMLVCYHA